MSNGIPFRLSPRSPTSLDFVKVTALTGQIAHITNEFGAKVSSTITSTTLTGVENFPGPGYVTFAALLNATSNTVATPKIRIVIDGKTVLDESSTTITSTESLSIVGRAFKNTVGGNTESRIDFKSSFVVSIAGDGVDGVAFAYKKVLT